LNASLVGRGRRVDAPSTGGRGIRFARKRLDLSLLDVFRGLAFCARQRRRRDVLASVASAWDPAENAVVALSVRSGFDLLLGAVDWAPGSEVVLSAVTIPHVAALVRSHGYVPVSVDLDPHTLEVDVGVVEAACTERTRAVVIAQLFGARADLTVLASATAARGLLLIEDCAQCYDGTDRHLGKVDIAMYSFGTIKTATCLGGAVLVVRDPMLRSRMCTRQASYPTQPTREYVWKLLKAAVLLMVGVPTVYRAFSGSIRALGLDYDAAIRHMSREFDDRDLLVRIRRRPCTALLAMMATGLRAMTLPASGRADKLASSSSLSSHHTLSTLAPEHDRRRIGCSPLCPGRPAASLQQAAPPVSTSPLAPRHLSHSIRVAGKQPRQCPKSSMFRSATPCPPPL
jgi:hypothetical protein